MRAVFLGVIEKTAGAWVSKAFWSHSKC